jgi:hypothetical protein
MAGNDSVLFLNLGDSKKRRETGLVAFVPGSKNTDDLHRHEPFMFVLLELTGDSSQGKQNRLGEIDLIRNSSTQKAFEQFRGKRRQFSEGGCVQTVDAAQGPR